MGLCEVTSAFSSEYCQNLEAEQTMSTLDLALPVIYDMMELNATSFIKKILSRLKDITSDSY